MTRTRAIRAGLALVAALVLTACPPPPPAPPAPPAGSPTHSAQLTLSSSVCAHPPTDCQYHCNLTHYATYDLGYQSLMVTGRIAVSGCPIDDWIDIVVTATCRRGNDTCGGPWIIPAGRADRQEIFRFNYPPSFGVLQINLGATNIYAGPGDFQGSTPTIHCYQDELVCRFQ